MKRRDSIVVVSTDEGFIHSLALSTGAIRKFPYALMVARGTEAAKKLFAAETAIVVLDFNVGGATEFWEELCRIASQMKLIALCKVGDDLQEPASSVILRNATVEQVVDELRQPATAAK